MATKTDTERIDILEKRVTELKEQVASAPNSRLFMKAIIMLFLISGVFFIWKARNIIKWLILALIAWWVFGGSICNLCSSICDFISNTWTEMQVNDKAKDNHDREMERLKTEADNQVMVTRVEAEARIQVINAEEAAKQTEWERSQAERRNDAVNEAIRNGKWTNDVPIENKAPSSPKFERPYHCPTNVKVYSDGPQPKIERTVNGNTTRVVVKF